MEIKNTQHSPKVFISYSQKEDKLITELIRKSLIDCGASVFIDSKLAEENDFISLTKENIEKSDYILLIISSDYLKSDWCLFELGMAISSTRGNREKIITPLVLDNSELPNVLKKYHAHKWNNDYEKIFETIGLYKNKNTKKRILEKPPGYFYSFISRLILNKKSHDEVMEPSILMMQESYFDAYFSGRKIFAQWIKIRFIYYFLIILGMNLPLIKQLIDIKEKIAK